MRDYDSETPGRGSATPRRRSTINSAGVRRRRTGIFWLTTQLTRSTEHISSKDADLPVSSTIGAISSSSAAVRDCCSVWTSCKLVDRRS